ncbi:MAG TPA: BamA/TamA family outer membrane protein, partial [Acidocella sp.]|nr:BamA/TamA family outer membrane protein [Acidocella sp.]
GGSDFSVLASLPASVSFDSTGSLLDPEKGERLTFQAQPVFGTSGGLRAFLTLSGVASAYRALDADSKLVAAVRIRLGTILFAPESGVPADLRYYSGGGGSVRGFGYQRVGPRDATDNPTGGRALGETSFELRYRAWTDIGVVGFVDAGTVSASPYFADAGSPRVGAGLGLRYYTGFGPLRLDIGVPVNPLHGDAPVQVYVSVGQAF